MKGQEGGQTWEYRAGYIDGMLAGRTKAMDQLRDQDI